MGAVNCVVRKDDQWIGENTTERFVSSLKTHRPSQKKSGHFWSRRCSPIISVEVALAGASHITIVNRSAERGEEITKLLQDKLPCYADFASWESTYSIPEDTDVVINATSIGLFPVVDARLDFDLNTLTSEMVVADVIPNPPSTNLVKDARAKGCKVIDGLGMLVNQGVIGVQHWTGINPDPTVMRTALEKVFG